MFWLTVYIFLPICLQDPASSTGSEADSDTREGEPATINYKPSPLQMKIGEPQLRFFRYSNVKVCAGITSALGKTQVSSEITAFS